MELRIGVTVAVSVFTTDRTPLGDSCKILKRPISKSVGLANTFPSETEPVGDTLKGDHGIVS